MNLTRCPRAAPSLAGGRAVVGNRTFLRTVGPALGRRTQGRREVVSAATEAPGSQERSQRSRAYGSDSDGEDDAPTNVEVGWLWDSAAEATEKRLKAAGKRPKKSLGQNFLTDDKVLAAIVRASEVRSGDVVIEIGPGTGNLTRHLMDTGAAVLAIEKDDKLIGVLEEEFGGAENFDLVHDNILTVNLPEIIWQLKERYNVDRVKVVANLPYYLTTELLQIMLPMGDLVSELTLMIQDEVAQRLVSKKTGGKGYRAMTVRCHFYSEPTYVFRIDKDLYIPAPKVDGALVRFALKRNEELPEVSDIRSYLRYAKQAFGERRKMMRNSLHPLYDGDAVAQALEEMGKPASARAQDISPSEHVALYNRIEELSPCLKGFTERKHAQ